MNVESSTPRSVGRPRRGGGAAEAPSTAVRRVGAELDDVLGPRFSVGGGGVVE